MKGWCVTGMLLAFVGLSGLSPMIVQAAADRGKLLSEPGVYASFVAYRIDSEWSKQETTVRIAQLTAFRGVVEQYREKLAIDTYLLRGLSEHADILLRIHGAELRDIQQFLLDLRGSAFGKSLIPSVNLVGVTKTANYVPGMPESLKAELKGPSEPGSNPYVVVIPIRKGTEWWALSQEQRAEMMQEHTEAALPYQKTVKRKLYHSTGLDDYDFITYFETSKLDDFQSLILSLHKVKEARYNRRFGHPTLVGMTWSLEQLIEVLAQ